METINKEKIADKIKQNLGFSKSFSQDILDNIFSEMLKIINSGKSLTITNFGRFSMVHKKERPGRDFRNDSVMIVPAKTIARFVASVPLKKKINIAISTTVNKAKNNAKKDVN